MITQFDPGLAQRGLIVPDFVTFTAPDESDPDGWYEQVEVTELSQASPFLINGTWHGRMAEATELVWRWLEL